MNDDKLIDVQNLFQPNIDFFSTFPLASVSLSYSRAMLSDCLLRSRTSRRATSASRRASSSASRMRRTSRPPSVSITASADLRAVSACFTAAQRADCNHRDESLATCHVTRASCHVSTGVVTWRPALAEVRDISFLMTSSRNRANLALSNVH